MRILKVDYMHPLSFLLRKKSEAHLPRSIDREHYLQWALSLRSNFSDFFTHAFNKLGCSSEEYILFDPDYTRLVLRELGGRESVRRVLLKLRNRNWEQARSFEFDVLRSYILEKYKPDVIYVREHSAIPSRWWQEFRPSCRIVCSISCPLPRDWHPMDFDLVLTTVPKFREFFQLAGVRSELIRAGFDGRILKELQQGKKKFDVSFVGGVSLGIFSQRTRLLETVARERTLNWWGYGLEGLPGESALRKSFRGVTGGLEMYQILSDSKIVLNDYINMADGNAVNQRLYEVMGVGSLLLTRESPTLKVFPKDVLDTYKSEAECLEKIDYYLNNEDHRERIAGNARRYIKEHYGYEPVAASILGVLNEMLQKAAA